MDAGKRSSVPKAWFCLGEQVGSLREKNGVISCLGPPQKQVLYVLHLVKSSCLQRLCLLHCLRQGNLGWLTIGTHY